ncbi:hypothetical protein [Microbulbifer epialgicus]|uniref:Uncharacterized protein n=1 Tax=Microbulbifer epialgicus TaxID=393907 RepID=A0ABV4P5N7_9GAMM
MIQDYTSYLMLIIPFIWAFAFWSARSKMIKKYGTEYISVIASFQWKCLKGMGFVAIYCALAWRMDDWDKILNGVAFAAGALTFFAMSAHELSCGFYVNHQYTNLERAVRLYSRFNIVGLITSFIVLVIVYQSESVHLAGFIFQVVLFFIAALAFYVNGSLVGLVKIGYEFTAPNITNLAKRRS